MELNSEIKEGSRVRVSLHKNGYHVRNFIGTCKGWTKAGKVKVLEDGATKNLSVDSEDVKLLKQ
jgi:hypothetical protein